MVVLKTIARLSTLRQPTDVLAVSVLIVITKRIGSANGQFLPIKVFCAAIQYGYQMIICGRVSS